MNSRIKATFTKRTHTLMVNTGRYRYFYITPTIKNIDYRDSIYYRGREHSLRLYKKDRYKTLNIVPIFDGYFESLESIRVPLEVI